MTSESPLAAIDTQRTISDRTYQRLKDDIISGKLPQGSKLVEEELARAYGISRGPLREAIRRLEGVKLLERIPHAGVRVVTLNYKMMSDIYGVREALEGMAARLAAEHMSKEKIRDLQELLVQHARSIEEVDGKAYFQNEGNFDFHYRIGEASGNQWLIQHLYHEMYQIIRMCRHQSAQTPDRPQKALAEHQQIVDAISARDGELAEMLMRRHIRGAWNIVKEFLPRTNHD